MKDLAIHYFEELVREADKENPHKVPITVRVHPHVVKRLERIAKQTGKSRAEVGADILAEGSEELATHLAYELQMDPDTGTAFIYGGNDE